MQNELRKAPADFSWIPNAILNDKNLSLKAKGLWVYINGKPEGWQFSAERIAAQNGDGTKAVISAIKELESAGFLVRERQPSGRVIYSLLPKKSFSQKGKVPKRQNDKIGKISNKDLIVKKNNSKKDSLIKDKSLIKGDTEVAELFDYWQEKTGIQPANTKLNRRSAYNLIRSKKLEGAKKCVDLAAKALKSSDKYAPRVASFAEFYGADSKLPKLEAWQAKQEATKPKMPYFFQRPSYLDEEDHKGTIPKEKFAKYREIALRRA